MGVIKKTSLMFGGSVLLFFILAFVDEYENLFATNKDKELVVADPYEIESTLKGYVADLSRIYLDPLPELIAELPLSDELRKELSGEIEFLKNDGRVQKLDIRNIWMQDVNQVGPDKVRVTTREIMGLSYLNRTDGTKIRSFPPAAFDMSYVMEHREGRWIIIRYDEMGIEELKAGGS